MTVWDAKYSVNAFAELKLKFPQAELNVQKLEQLLDHSFFNKGLAAAALTHRSALVYWNSEVAPVASNEVLEFYGDSVLSFVVSTVFMESFSHYKEGDLSKMRSLVVGTENLALKCEELGLQKLLFTGKGEQVADGARKTNMLADCFEAVLGAFVLDGGLAKAEAWLRNVLAADFISAPENLGKSDSKSALQQYIQTLGNVHPVYKLLGSESTHTETLFIVGVFIGNKELARAKALNKRDASKLAAKEVLLKIERKVFSEVEMKKLVLSVQK